MSLVSFFKVQLLVKEIVFYIIYTNTPFLISLQDLNSLNYYYNNLTDKVITPILIVLVAQQFGHPFLLQGKTLQQFITISIISKIYYLTVIELLQLYRRFGHPSIRKLYTLLKYLGHNINKEIIKKLTKYYRYY